MAELHDICRKLRADGVPLYVRNNTTLAGARWSVSYGYDNIGVGLSDREAALVVETAEKVHRSVAS
jgi:hypothetical protein